MLTEPPKPKEMVFSESDGIPTRIFNSYKSAIESFNSNNWRATVTECGRVIEGIVKTSANVGNGNLSDIFAKLNKSLKENADHRQLLQPMTKLREAFRLGRNTSAHFDLEKEVDKATSQKILELTEFLMMYFYTLATKAEEAEKSIKELNPNEENHETED